jgi:hypothetical protein
MEELPAVEQEVCTQLTVKIQSNTATSLKCKYSCDSINVSVVSYLFIDCISNSLMDKITVFS